MAEAGVTKLEAVNDILHSTGRGTVGALDTGNASDAADAERILDRMTQVELTRGWPCNTISGKVYTAVDVGGGVYNIDLNSDSPLRVECTGPGPYKGLVSLNGSLARYLATGSTDFESAVSLTLTVYQTLAWANLAPDLKEVILERAKAQFRLYYAPDDAIEARLQANADRAELMADRLRGEAYMTQNSSPIILGGGFSRGGSQN